MKDTSNKNTVNDICIATQSVNVWWDIFNNYFIANCPENVTVKNLANWLIFSKDMDSDKVGRFLGTQCKLCVSV